MRRSQAGFVRFGMAAIKDLPFRSQVICLEPCIVGRNNSRRQSFIQYLSQASGQLCGGLPDRDRVDGSLAYARRYFADSKRIAFDAQVRFDCGHWIDRPQSLIEDFARSNPKLGQIRHHSTVIKSRSARKRLSLMPVRRCRARAATVTWRIARKWATASKLSKNSIFRAVAARGRSGISGRRRNSESLPTLGYRSMNFVSSSNSISCGALRLSAHATG